MATPAFPNEYILRTVAETSSKPCSVCHRPTTKVLITPDNKDFLYTCSSHLLDRGFATPVVDEKAEAEKRKAEELAKEKEAVIREYEERMKKKKKKKDSKDEDSKKKDADADGGNEEAEKDAKLKAIDAKASAAGSTGDDGPREFTLHRNFYQMRLDRRANIEKARRDQARMQNPGFFPSAPKGDLV